MLLDGQRLRTSDEENTTDATFELFVTHNRTFHCDEVMAYAMAKILYPNLAVVRTRSKEAISLYIDNKNALIVDVGGVHCPPLQFDHHQKGFDEEYHMGADDKPLDRCNPKYPRIPVLMSSCGLFWKHYGEDIINKVLNDKTDESFAVKVPEDFTIDDSNMKAIKDKIYNRFILPIDANDNGINQYDEDAVKNFSSDINIPTAVSKFNRDPNCPPLQMDQFIEAFKFCSSVLLNFLKSTLIEEIEYITYKPIFEEISNKRRYLNVKTDEGVFDNQILVSDRVFPGTVYNRLLREYDSKYNILFTIMRRNDVEYNVWTRSKNKFDTIAKVIPKDTAERLGIKDIKFVHNNGFIAVTTNRLMALRLAQQSLSHYNGQKRNKLYWRAVLFGMVILLISVLVKKAQLTSIE